MQKFFVNQKQINEENKTIVIQGEDVKHIENVLRLKIDENIEVSVNSEDEKIYLCKIDELKKDSVLCSIINTREENIESNVYINLIQSLPKMDKMEFIIEKGTELGVKEFTPLSLNRCVVKIEHGEEKKKIERWEKIALSAAKQSKRNTVPKINNIHNIEKLFYLIQKYDIVLLAYEKETINTLKSELKKINKVDNLKVAIIVGPEGGIEEREIVYLTKKLNNLKIVSLGKRILRTETAGIVIVSNVLYELE